MKFNLEGKIPEALPKYLLILALVALGVQGGELIALV